MIEVTAFTADVVGMGKIALTWSEADPGSLKSIGIERSRDGIHFEQIGECRQPVNFNYRYLDETADSGCWYYRLRLEPKKGAYSYSIVCQAAVPSLFRTRACAPPLPF